MISMFKDLLEMAEQQTNPQRLLFLFAQTETSNKSRKQQEKRGSISPTMVVDKLPTDLTDFPALVKEADDMSKDWNFVFIASLAGENNQPPSTEQAEPFLKQMTDDVMTGNNIHRYVVFDRQEQPIELMAN